MVYSLTAVSMEEKQLTSIQKRATTQFTRMCGYEMTFPKAAVHGPKCFGGLGFKHLYVESNVNKIEAVICHVNKQTKLGKIMLMNLNWIQLHSGIRTPILEHKKKG
jgi:hypothetical protein